MFAYEDNSAGILVNIDNLSKKGIWNGVKVKDIKYFNIDKYEIDEILSFIINKGFKKLIDDNTQVNINMLSNLKKTYFYIRRDDKYARKYYMRKNYNCSDYDIKKGRINKYYLMGVIVVRDDLDEIKKGTSVIIDWIRAYYKKTDTAKCMIDILEKQFGITLIPTNIRPAPNYWKKYLKKNDKVYNFNMFINYLWNSSYNIENYFNIAYDIEGYNKIYDIDDENIYLRLLYDY